MARKKKKEVYKPLGEKQLDKLDLIIKELQNIKKELKRKP
jgi:hypothetical protein